MAVHSEEEILQAFKVLSGVINTNTYSEVLVLEEAFANEHPTLQMGFYRVLNGGLLRRLREGWQGGGIVPANGNPAEPPPDQRIAADAATFARSGYLPFI